MNVSDYITPACLVALDDLRAQVFAAIDCELAVDGHCKSYEGRFAIILPNRFVDDRGEWGDASARDVALELSCYQLCDGRHDVWTGATLGECVAKAREKLRLEHRLKEYVEAIDDTPEAPELLRARVKTLRELLGAA